LGQLELHRFTLHQLTFHRRREYRSDSLFDFGPKFGTRLARQWYRYAGANLYDHCKLQSAFRLAICPPLSPFNESNHELAITIMPSIATLIKFDYDTPKGLQYYQEEVDTWHKLLP
jgi:hypothetical protein